MTDYTGDQGDESTPKQNIRPCKLCGKMVNFSEPWCDHETMEESAWRNMGHFTDTKLTPSK